MRLFKDVVRNQQFISGIWRPGQSDEALKVMDPYTGEMLAEIPFADGQQVESAIQGAVKGFEVFRKWSAGKRADHLRRLYELLFNRKAAFADLIVAEAGKPLAYARMEVDRALDTLDTAARECLHFAGEVVPMDYKNGEGRTAYTARFPIGPVTAISPFNFPLNLVLHKLAPAFAVGCPVVLKPAPQAPLTALAFAALVEEAGYPAGALSVLICANSEAELLVRDSRIRFLSFTGSPAVGWKLREMAGPKRVLLELGGNAALIVDETADLDHAALAIAKGGYLYAGQVCISTQRVYVVALVFEALKEKLLVAIAQVRTGDPRLEGTVCGPMIDSAHGHRIQAWVNEAVAQGAEVLAGGNFADVSKNLFAPTLLTHTLPGMKVVAEEVFGPVVIMEKVPDFQSALQAANASRFGLQAGVFTNRMDHVLLAHQTLEVGAVIINQAPGFRIDSMPYGGVKASGLGREGVRYAMEAMTEPRLLVY